jgi:hypothetical protein
VTARRDGDRGRAAAVLGVAGIAAYVSYWHAYEVVCLHGETGVTARQEPATIDGLVYASIGSASGAGLPILAARSDTRTAAESCAMSWPRPPAVGSPPMTSTGE